MRHQLDKANLRGIRVVDFSWVMAGPMATKMLGAMGAEIIKIESRARPEFSQREGTFSVINNNKRSCTVNLRSAEGQELLRRLIGTSDVVVENFSSGVLQKYGLTYGDLRPLKPDLIFVSASGLGRSGPQRDLLAYGSLLQGYSGRVGMIGNLNPFLEAMGILPAWTDPITALWETLAVLAALHHRDRSGQGCYIDLSMLESTVALLPEALIRAALGQPEGEPGSMTEPEAAPSGCFRCAGADDWLAVSVRTDGEWHGLCRCLEWRDLAGAPGYADRRLRLEAKDALNEKLAAALRSRSAAETERLLGSMAFPPPGPGTWASSSGTTISAPARSSRTSRPRPIWVPCPGWTRRAGAAPIRRRLPSMRTTTTSSASCSDFRVRSGTS